MIKKCTNDVRIENEKAHGKGIAADAESLWHWAGPIGTARYQRRVEYLSSGLHRGVRCLEVGCGTGVFTQGLASTGADIAAVDISHDLLMRSSKRSLPVQLFQSDVGHLPFKNDSFDEVVGSSILHHLNIKLGLEEIYRVLKRGGRIRFTEPNYLNPHVFLERKVPFLRKRLSVTKYETAFIRSCLKKRLVHSGFSAVTIEPFDFMYPFLPGSFLQLLRAFSELMEKIPFVREIAGSLQIAGVK
jgi:SAM-dependent methyltransferase